jgi:hypothetical protein
MTIDGGVPRGGKGAPPADFKGCILPIQRRPISNDACCRSTNGESLLSVTCAMMPCAMIDAHS